MRAISISILVLVLFIALPVAGFRFPQAHPVPPFGQTQPKDEQREQIEKDMAKRANKERQDNLRRDADQLLKLATELKQYVDKSNENVLSLNVIQKSEEIEKLAHSVKEKMKGQ